LKINIFIIEDIAESLGHFPLSFLQVYFDGKHMYTTSQDNYDRIKIKVGEASDKADKVLYTAQGYKIIGIPKQKSILREEEFIVKTSGGYTVYNGPKLVSIALDRQLYESEFSIYVNKK